MSHGPLRSTARPRVRRFLRCRAHHAVVDHRAVSPCRLPFWTQALTYCRPAPTALAQVTMEDYPEAGMSALKYYTIQSYTK
eukprot:2051892-Prymnesium_polylepis.1